MSAPLDCLMSAHKRARAAIVEATNAAAEYQTALSAAESRIRKMETDVAEIETAIRQLGGQVEG